MPNSHIGYINYASIIRLSVLLLIGFSVSVNADESGEAFLVHNFYWENDLFANTDTDYTNGVRYSLAAAQTKDVSKSKLPKFLKTANIKLIDFYKSVYPNQESAETKFIATFAQRMYTPRDKLPVSVIVDQRPYAGWLYLGMANHIRVGRRMDTLELDVGIIGPAALGRELQDKVHDLRGITKFKGWNNQLANEPGISIIFERKQKTKLIPLAFDMEADIIGHWGGSIGNVATYLNGGIEMRIGWELPDDFGTSTLRPGGDNSVPRGTSKGSIHFFTSIDTRLIARNIFLDGNTFENSHSVDKKAVVADAAIGLSFDLGRFKVSYARMFRTKEFDLQPSYNSYGSIAISYWHQI
ncbi:MAG: lipid A 3-O-deacylase [Candidatus Azotimanducaceae bacterium]|jgi:lipid A 3-O-deacylase